MAKYMVTNLNTAIFFNVCGNSFAQWQNSIRGGVAMMTITQCFHSSLNDVIRGFKIRLSDAEADNIPTGIRQGLRLG
jgi:hypothetical protein